MGESGVQPRARAQHSRENSGILSLAMTGYSVVGYQMQLRKHHRMMLPCDDLMDYACGASTQAKEPGLLRDMQANGTCAN